MRLFVPSEAESAEVSRVLHPAVKGSRSTNYKQKSSLAMVGGYPRLKQPLDRFQIIRPLKRMLRSEK
jgi:hypothetical protein